MLPIDSFSPSSFMIESQVSLLIENKHMIDTPNIAPKKRPKINKNTILHLTKKQRCLEIFMVVD